MRGTRTAFTLVEVMVAGSLAFIVTGGLLFMMAGERRVGQASSQYLGMVEGAGLAIHQLRTDLRQASFVPGQPIDPYSIRISDDNRAIRLRRSNVPDGVIGDAQLGSAFVLVEYSLEPSDARAGLFHLVRRQWAPVGGAQQDVRVFSSFQLEDASFLLAEDDAKDERLLHVGLVVAADGEGASGPAAGRRTLVLTSTLTILRPEAPLDLRRWPFAQPMLGPAETPPGDVRQPDAPESGPLDAPSSDGTA